MTAPSLKQGENFPLYKMDSETFERLCTELLECEDHIANCSRYGPRGGQKQYGADILAHRMDGGIELGQCKCHKTFSARKLQKVSDEFLKNWSHWTVKEPKRIVLFVACELNNRKIQDQICAEKKRFQKKGVEYEAFGAPNIFHKLRPHPGIVKNYFSHGEYWVRKICDVPLGKERDVSGESASTLVSVDSALAHFTQELQSRVAADVENELADARQACVEGRQMDAISWIRRVKEDRVKWQSVSDGVKAQVLLLEAGLELRIQEDTTAARQLADDALNHDPERDQTRLRTLIERIESGPESALKFLEGKEGVDVLNLKAALLLELGRTSDALRELERAEEQHHECA